MGGYTAVADASNTILKLLRDNMLPEPIPGPEMIGLCSPAEKGDFRLGLYLYSTRENGEFNNTRTPGVPPLSLSLYYLLTAYSTAELKSRAYDEYCILGRAMQVMNDNGIVGNSALQGTLAENNEELRIKLNYLSPDEMSKIWTFPDVPYRLSVGYIVGPVTISAGGGGDVRRVMR